MALHFIGNLQNDKHFQASQKAAIHALLLLNCRHSVHFAYLLLTVFNVRQLLAYRIIILTSKLLTNRAHRPPVVLSYDPELNYPLRSIMPFSIVALQICINHAIFSFAYIATTFWNALAIH